MIFEPYLNKKILLLRSNLPVEKKTYGEFVNYISNSSSFKYNYVTRNLLGCQIVFFTQKEFIGKKFGEIMDEIQSTDDQIIILHDTLVGKSIKKLYGPEYNDVVNILRVDKDLNIYKNRNKEQMLSGSQKEILGTIPQLLREYKLKMLVNGI